MVSVVTKQGCGGRVRGNGVLGRPVGIVLGVARGVDGGRVDVGGGRAWVIEMDHDPKERYTANVSVTQAISVEF